MCFAFWKVAMSLQLFVCFPIYLNYLHFFVKVISNKGCAPLLSLPTNFRLVIVIINIKTFGAAASLSLPTTTLAASFGHGIEIEGVE
jgi:hypothetical protein